MWVHDGANNSSQIGANMPRLTIRLMIVEDLGYCCLPFFFSRYKKNTLVADRLGVSARAVRYAREATRDEPPPCTNCDQCLLRRIGDRKGDTLP